MLSTDIAYLSTLSILLPAIIAVVVYKRIPPPLKILSVMVFITTIFEGVGICLAKQGINNMIVVHSYTYIEFLAISLMYISMIGTNRFKRVAILFIILFFSLSAVNLIYFEDSNRYNSIQRVIEFAFLACYFISYISKIVRIAKNPYVELHPYFILTIALIIYFSGTLLIFFGMNTVNDSNGLALWIIYSLLNIGRNIVYFIVLWNHSRMNPALS